MLPVLEFTLSSSVQMRDPYSRIIEFNQNNIFHVDRVLSYDLRADVFWSSICKQSKAGMSQSTLRISSQQKIHFCIENIKIGFI